MTVTTLVAPVPAADDYSVSIELWQRLEDEIKLVSARIEAGDNLVPDDVANIQKLKKQVDGYVTDFNKAMRNDMEKYRKMVDKMLTDLGYDTIEQFVAKKRQEQSISKNERIQSKMDNMNMILNGLVGKTKRLKDVPMAKELLPAFTARFPKVQSGAKNNDIVDWQPYFSIMYRTIMIMDAFFCDSKYEDAVFLPLYSNTIRELLAYAKDGKEEHLANVRVRFEEDRHFIHEAKLKASMQSKADGIDHIRQILADIDDIGSLSEAAKQVRTEQAWEEISLIVRLINNP